MSYKHRELLPPSGYIYYEKINGSSFRNVMATGFTYDSGNNRYRIGKTDFTSNDCFDWFFYYSLDEICFTDAEGEKISCALKKTNYENNPNVRLFPAPGDEKITIPAEVILNEVIKGRKIHFTVTVNMGSHAYNFFSPTGISFRYHKEKSSDWVAGNFVPDPAGGYSFQKIDKEDPVRASKLFYFNLFYVCLEKTGGPVCHSANIRADSFDGSVNNQTLRFPLY